MRRFLTVEQMRAADEYTINTLKVPAEELMRRAGEALYQEVKDVAQTGARILVVCGTGNNGGDGYVLAQLLKKGGYNVRVYALDGRLSPDCKREKERYEGEYARNIEGDIIADCIFGTGLSRMVEGEGAAVIRAINESGAYVISADVPSGLGSGGLVCGICVKADKTIAIGEFKTCFALGDGLDFCGVTVRKDIGITLCNDNFCYICEDEDIAAYYPFRKRNTHKGSYGAATLVCGSKKYVGSAVLAAAAANISGCGYVKVVCPSEVRAAIAPKYPQTVFDAKIDLKCNATAIGMGCGVSRKVYGIICRLLKNYKGTLIIDADAINCLAKYGDGVFVEKKCKVIITPHAKEFSRLTGDSVESILSDPLGKAKKYALANGVVVLLKGAGTVITDGVKAVINIRGNTALAKAGSGDMLSGYMCGSIARGLSPFDGAVCASYTLGAAAELAGAKYSQYCATYSAILENVCEAVKKFTRSE